MFKGAITKAMPAYIGALALMGEAVGDHIRRFPHTADRELAAGSLRDRYTKESIKFVGIRHQVYEVPDSVMTVPKCGFSITLDQGAGVAWPFPVVMTYSFPSCEIPQVH